MNRFNYAAVVAALLLGSTFAVAKPIAFSHGTTVMAEYGAGTMKEAQVFYAPKYFLSLGPGYLELESDIDHRRREITYARVNYLAKRWNMEAAQANVFVWGGAGQAYVSETNDHEFTGNAGAQFDYETRRVYSSLKTDLVSRPRISPIASTRCSWASRPTSMTTTSWRPGWWCRRGGSRARSTKAPSGRCCCGCSRAAAGSKPA